MPQIWDLFGEQAIIIGIVLNQLKLASEVKSLYE